MNEIFEKVLKTIENVEDRKEMQLFLLKKKAVSKIQKVLDEFDPDCPLDTMYVFTFCELINKMSNSLRPYEDTGILHIKLIGMLIENLKECVSDWEENLQHFMKSE